jgi:long-subunit fatty acid transport protein
MEYLKHMKTLPLISIVTLLFAPNCSFGGVFERSGQYIDSLFSKGSIAELTLLRAEPSVRGADSLNQGTGNVSQAFGTERFFLKTDINGKTAIALDIDEPWGADFQYASSTPLYGGTTARLDSKSVTGLAQRKLTENMSVFGGMRFQNLSGELVLQGLAFGPLSGYQLDSKDDWESAYTLGLAYEIEKYAFRFSLAYHSEVEHKLETTETLSPNPTRTELITPQSVNLHFQSGVAPNTLFFSKIRWVNWSEFTFQPATLGQAVVNLDDDLTTYTLGIAYKISDKWVASIAYLYEPELANSNSLFQPSNGFKGAAIGAVYQVNKQWEVSVNYNRTEVGDAGAETLGGNRVTFLHNHSNAIRLRIKHRFK